MWAVRRQTPRTLPSLQMNIKIFLYRFVDSVGFRIPKSAATMARIRGVRLFFDGSRQQIAPRGHDDLHGDVEARGGSRRDQFVAGVPRFRWSNRAARARGLPP